MRPSRTLAIHAKTRSNTLPDAPPRRDYPLPPWPDAELADLTLGDENRLALNAARRVAADPGERYNPFFVFGPAGCGKTHLLYGLGRALKAGGLRRTIALPAAEFAEWCDDAWRNRATPELRERLWRADALLIDDVHALAQRPAALEELYHAYNRLMADGKQLVFASSLPPARMTDFAAAVRHRFVSGLVAELAAPGPTLLRNILVQRAEAAGLTLSRPAAELLGERAQSPREAVGFIATLAQRPVRGGRVALEQVRTLLEDLETPQITIPQIAHAVCAHYHVTVAAVRSARRLQELAHARQMAMFLARRLTKASLLEIGEYFGGRDHSTVLYAIRKTADLAARDHRWGRPAAELEAALKAAATAQ